MSESQHPNPAFNETAERFLAYYDTVRGYVRREVTRENLTNHLPNTGAHAIDLGGGDGSDALWLTEQGFETVLIEPSGAMIERAFSRVKAHPRKVQKNITIIQGNQTTFERHARETPTHLLLSHGVLMYQDKPIEYLNTLALGLAEGGVLSLLTKGYSAKRNQLLADHRYEDVERLDAGLPIANRYHPRTWAFSPDVLGKMCEDVGLNVVAWYGVRIDSDDNDTPVSELSSVDLQEILESEIEASRDPAKKQFGHMLHFVAVKQ